MQNGSFGLTPREIDVAWATVSGLTNLEIATYLGISEHTVKHHLMAIFRKLGVSTRTFMIEEFLAIAVGIPDNVALEVSFREKLTPTEWKVLKHTLGGSNAETANSLGISKNTVKHHLTRIFRKLQVSSRSELASLIYRSDIGGMRRA